MDMKISKNGLIIAFVALFVLPFVCAQELTEASKQEIIGRAWDYLDMPEINSMNLGNIDKVQEPQLYHGNWKVTFLINGRAMDVLLDQQTLAVIGHTNFGLEGDNIERYTEEQCENKAMNFFNRVITSHIDEYYFEGTTKDAFSPLYIFRWTRRIGDIPVNQNGAIIAIDWSNENIIMWSNNYEYDASEIDTLPTITKEQAEMVVLDAYGGEIMKAPYLVIHGKDLLWDMTLRFPESVTYGVIPTVKLGIDSDTGETKYFNPSMGSSVQQVPTSFDPAKYPQPINWYGLAIMGLIIAGCAICIGKDKLRRAIGMAKQIMS